MYHKKKELNCTQIMRVTPKSLYLTADFDSFLARGLFELFLFISKDQFLFISSMKETSQILSLSIQLSHPQRVCVCAHKHQKKKNCLNLRGLEKKFQ